MACQATPGRAIISFGRKNGKTALSAMLLLLHLCGPEARPNSQLYSAAQSRDQAAILFNLAAKMVRFSPTLAAFVIPGTPSRNSLARSWARSTEPSPPTPRRPGGWPA